jgi:hypothetical protein
MAFFSVCNEGTPATGITHCVSAYWMQRRSEALQPNIILARVTQLEVYSVLPCASPAAKTPAAAPVDGVAPEPANSSGWVMELEATHSRSTQRSASINRVWWTPRATL